MKQKIRLLLIILLTSTLAYSQNSNEYDPYLANPSLGGFEEIVKIGSLYQTAMTAYDYNPKSIILWGTSPFNNQRVAGGFKIASQEGGVLRNISAEATFIYRVPVLDGSMLSFALSGSMNQLELLKNRAEVLDPNDPILQGSQSGNWFNSNFGFALSKVNTYYFGLAAYNLLPKKTDWMVSNFENKSDITYVSSGMYRFNMNNVELEIVGNLSTNQIKDLDWFRYNLVTKAIFLKSFWIGAGYSNGKTIRGLVGLNFQNLSFGYTGHYSFNDLENYAMPEHEIIISLKIPYSKQSKN